MDQNRYLELLPDMSVNLHFDGEYATCLFQFKEYRKNINTLVESAF